MIVQCRTCATRYHLDDTTVGSKGCHVRCTSCGAIWIQKPLPLSHPPLMVLPTVETLESPASLWHKRLPIFWIGVAGFALLAVGIMAFSWGRQTLGWMPFSEELNELASLSASVPSMLELISFSFQKEAKSPQVTCQGTLYNGSSRTIKAPTLIVLFAHALSGNPKGTLVPVRHTFAHMTLTPGEIKPFSIVLTSPVPQFLFATAFIP